MLRSLGHVRPRPGALTAWTRGHYREAPFPPAPWAGTEDVRPITDWAALKALALEFRNCVRTYHREVMDGRSYFYRYAEGGKPVAVVELERLPVAGWVIGEVLGPENEDVAPSVMLRLRAAFEAGSIAHVPEQVNLYSLFGER